MTDIAKLILDADTRGLKRGEGDLDRLSDQSRKTAREVDEGATRMGASFRRIGLAVTGAATAAIGFFAKQSIQTAMDAQEMQSAFEVVFGSMSEDMRTWAEATGDAMGRSTQEIQRGALAFQELFGKALDPAKAAEMSKQFAVLTQDLASFKNLSNEVAQQKLFSGLVGESEPLRAVGVFLNEAALQAKAAEMGLKGVNGALTDQEKIIARAAIIQEQLAAAQGDVIRTQDSAANTIRAAQAAYEELQVTVGNALLPTFTALAQEVVSGINTLQSLTSTLGITANGISTLISVVKSAVVGWVAYRGTLLAVQAAQLVVNSTGSPLIATIASTTRVVGVAAGAQVALSAATAGVTTVFRALTAAMIANPFAAVAVVVGTLSAAMFGLAESQRAARAETNALIGSLRSLAQARSADYAAKRAEAVAEQSRLEGEIMRLEGLTKRPGLAGSFAAQGVGKEIFSLRQQLVEVNGELTAADNAFKAAGEAANAMSVPVAGAAAAVGKLSGGGGGGGGVPAATKAVDQFAQSLQAVLDKAFPQKAALAELGKDIDVLARGYDKAAISQAEFFKGANNLFRDYADQFYGKLKPVSSMPDVPGLDPEFMKKQFELGMAELDKFGRKAGVATVRIEKTFKDMADGILGSLQGLVNGIKGGGFLDILGGVIDLLLQLGSAGVFGKSIQTNINKPIDGARANGGPVMGGKTYLVGERGPELFTAPGTGKIVSNDNLKGMGATQVQVVPSPYFDVVVDGRIVRSAPAVANAGAQLAANNAARAQRRTVRR